MRQLPLGVQLRPAAVFASFHAGGQAAAVAAVRSIASGASAVPVWLWGPKGTGKTHLLQAALAAWDESRGSAAYLPLGLAGISPEHLHGLDSCRLVVLDDVEAVVGNRALQEALFHLWNGLGSQGGRWLLAAAQPPAGLALALPDLASRFASSIVYHLPAPDEEDLAEILRLLARQRGLTLDSGVASFLLRRVRRDTHELAALVERLDAAALAAKRALTVPFVREVLGG
jgi:DnaA-homolog protein